MTTPSREEAPERVLLERFGDEVSDVHSRIIIVHQLRASAEIQDHQTKRETGWADTDDRATLMRKAADAIEALANREPSEGDVERVARTLYACESARTDRAASVLSEATGRPVPGMAMEPWDECKDSFLSDALAAINTWRNP